MTFEPPRCPHQSCEAFERPRGRIVRWGYYLAKCRVGRIRRYRCLECLKTFSTQTFRQDYRDNRPETNARLFELLTSGIGLRQAGRVLDLSCAAVQMKTDWSLI